MSGGIDSSVAACMLKEQGYDVTGIHLRFWADPLVKDDCQLGQTPQNKCCTIESLHRAKQVCDSLGVPFYVLNFEDYFKRNVVDQFIEGYKQGITPNPCIECNRKVKFGLFIEKMKEFGADFVATGHYARKIVTKENRYELWMAKDKNKDQTYFLYTLTQNQLKHTLFPLGDYTKKQIREIAGKYGIEEANKQKESQNLCFFPERKHNPFLKRYLRPEEFKPGPIITPDGEKIGTHQGLPNYTIGQRKGINIGGIKGREDEEGKPWFVVAIDKKKNALVVGKSNQLFNLELNAHTLSFVDGRTPAKSPLKKDIQAKIRYRFKEQPATLTINSKPHPEAKIKFKGPQRAITPGQSVVFYDGEKVLGGGIIA